MVVREVGSEETKIAPSPKIQKLGQSVQPDYRSGQGSTRDSSLISGPSDINVEYAPGRPPSRRPRRY